MQMEPVDCTHLCLDGQVQLVPVKAPVSLLPYGLLAISLLALAAVVLYYQSVMDRQQQQPARLQKKQAS